MMVCSTDLTTTTTTTEVSREEDEFNVPIALSAFRDKLLLLIIIKFIYIFAPGHTSSTRLL